MKRNQFDGVTKTTQNTQTTDIIYLMLHNIHKNPQSNSKFKDLRGKVWKFQMRNWRKKKRMMRFVNDECKITVKVCGLR